jgi:hypothetical protein
VINEEHASQHAGIFTHPRWVSAVVIIILAFLGFSEWSRNKQSVADLAQKIIDENAANNQLKVDFVSIPVYHMIPFASDLMNLGALPTQFSGYFSLKNKNGTQLSEECRAATIDYTVRIVSDGMISMQIPGAGLMTVNGCQS